MYELFIKLGGVHHKQQAALPQQIVGKPLICLDLQGWHECGQECFYPGSFLIMAILMLSAQYII